jgi:two-component system, OmpR family, response regulator BaeR
MSRILVVEDDTDIASLIVHYLTPAGYEAQVIANGSEALAAARQRPPDLIILDRMLPGLDGLEICRALRADPELGAVPILMLTARAEEIDRIAGRCG